MSGEQQNTEEQDQDAAGGAHPRLPEATRMEAGESGDPGDWASARERQLTAGLRASPAERLAWLEEAIALAHRAGALPKRR
jgi:hypothetical protein